jgi:hypothetical protein
MVHLEVSKCICSTDLHHDALELAFILEKLTDLFFAVVCHLVEPADDVTCKCLDHKWHRAVCQEAQRCVRNCLVDSRFCETSTITSASGWLCLCTCAGG